MCDEQGDKIKEYYVDCLLLAEEVVNEFLRKRRQNGNNYNKEATSILIAAVFNKVASKTDRIKQVLSTTSP